MWRLLRWHRIKTIENKKVKHFLGKQFYAMNGVGYYARAGIFDLYVIVGGNGFIIQIHPYPFVLAIVHRNPNLWSEEEDEQNDEIEETLQTLQIRVEKDKKQMEELNATEDISIYAIREMKDTENLEEVMEEFKRLLERDFVIRKSKNREC